MQICTNFNIQYENIARKSFFFSLNINIYIWQFITLHERKKLNLSCKNNQKLNVPIDYMYIQFLPKFYSTEYLSFLKKYILEAKTNSEKLQNPFILNIFFIKNHQNKYHQSINAKLNIQRISVQLSYGWTKARRSVFFSSQRAYKWRNSIFVSTHVASREFTSSGIGINAGLYPRVLRDFSDLPHPSRSQGNPQGSMRGYKPLRHSGPHDHPVSSSRGT